MIKLNVFSINCVKQVNTLIVTIRLDMFFLEEKVTA